MKTSDSINELATSLAKAQAKIVGALKDSANPFFKSKYADLASVWEATREPLTSNGLSIMQGVSSLEGGAVCVTTRLLHSSGQWAEDTLTLMPKDASPQGMGSAITYGRRYGLAAMTGCAQIDDDGEAAMGRTNGGIHHPQSDASRTVPPAVVASSVEKVRAVLAKDLDEDAQCLELYDLHTGFSRDSDLYMAVGKAMTEAKVLSSAQWKAAVKKGGEIARTMV